MAPGLVFTFGLVALLLVVNALRSPKPPQHRLPPLWLPAMITSEMAGVWLVLTPAVVGIALIGDVTWSRIGTAGVVMASVAALGQIVVWRRSVASTRSIGSPVTLPHNGFRRALSLPSPSAPGLTRTTHPFGPHPNRPGQLNLDIHRLAVDQGPRPVVVYLHGGGWRGGNRRQGARVIIQHLALQGWAVVAIDYPLSPDATFPQHLMGIDLAMDWIHSRDDLVGPVVLMGGSAGAHLAALAALTRTDIQGLIGLYGIYDMLNRNRIRVDWPLIPRAVMKLDRVTDPDSYRGASPLDQVHPNAPPSLIVHGSYDSLVPPEEGRQFVNALVNVGANSTLLEVPWGQHAFDALAGRRSRSVATRVGQWLENEIL